MPFYSGFYNIGIMQLFIQIPCYNEAETLPLTLAKIPRSVTGCRNVKVLIIDDGSSDRTAEIAREHGADHVIKMSVHQGLARAFTIGIEACVRLGADIIVNTDADNQYNAADIDKLTTPIIQKQADIVIGTRPIDQIKHFSLSKKLLQKIGSAVVRAFSGINIQDATSGFRALNREAALKLNIFSRYSYTLEMIIQAGQKNLTIVNMPIRVNGFLRPSRLAKSTLSYIIQSVKTIIRISVDYHPFRFFFIIGTTFIIAGTLLGVRFLWLFYHQSGNGHIQSLIFASIFFGLGAQAIIAAFITDVSAINRRIMEDVQYRLKCEQLKKLTE